MSCLMYDDDGNQFRARPFARNKLPIQRASAHRSIVIPNRSGDVPNPYTFKIVYKAIVPRLIVCLDEAQSLFDTTQNRLRPETGYANPKTINSPAF
jgi:hypothetical protein